jgi:hypothetical protein
VANTTIGIGIALLLLGIVGYTWSGGVSATALIPAYFGLPLLVLGALARNEKRRKLAMHIAVAVGLLGFLGVLYSLITRARMATPGMMAAQALMALLTGVFVGLSVKSFIDARRNR